MLPLGSQVTHVYSKGSKTLVLGPTGDCVDVGFILTVTRRFWRADKEVTLSNGHF